MVSLIGGREGDFMKKKQKIDPDMPIGKLTRIPDFLPSPAELAASIAKDNVRITVELSRASVNFFKKEAGRHHTKYQRMIRQVLDRYAAHHVA
jgi:predicted DNA binding CopG/RHH family protein